MRQFWNRSTCAALGITAMLAVMALLVTAPAGASSSQDLTKIAAIEATSTPASLQAIAPVELVGVNESWTLVADVTGASAVATTLAVVERFDAHGRDSDTRSTPSAALVLFEGVDLSGSKRGRDILRE